MQAKTVNTAYGNYEVTVKHTSDRHAEMYANKHRVYYGTKSKVMKTFDGLTSGRLVNMLKNLKVIHE